jgi:hypothetical protein
MQPKASDQQHDRESRDRGTSRNLEAPNRSLYWRRSRGASVTCETAQLVGGCRSGIACHDAGWGALPCASGVTGASSLAKRLFERHRDMQARREGHWRFSPAVLRCTSEEGNEMHTEATICRCASRPSKESQERRRVKTDTAPSEVKRNEAEERSRREHRGDAVAAVGGSSGP